LSLPWQRRGGGGAARGAGEAAAAGAAIPSLRARLARLEERYAILKPWLLFRAEDGVLILPPNKVYKLGGSGAAVLDWLARGGRLRDIPGMDEARAADLEAFLSEIEDASAGRPVELGRTPYDFAFTRLPVIGELALTYRCNSACLFCYAACGDAACGDSEAGGAGDALAHGAGGAGACSGAEASCDSPCRSGPVIPGKAELSTADARRVIRMFKEEAKIPFFSFTGGEPLLRDDLEELAACARDLGLRTNLITNGSLATPARAASLRAAGIETAQVSLESPDREVHDRLVAREGGFDRTVAGIANLLGAGISVQTNTTLTSLNRGSLARLPAFLKGLGVRRFSMNLFIPSGRGLSSMRLLVPYSEAGEVVDGIRKEALACGLTFFWYSPTPYCLYNPVARGLGNKSCAALDGLVHINPYGEILPCSSWPEPVGSILAKDFQSLWFSDRSSYFKNKEFAPEACKGCASFLACQGACPLYWRSVGTAEIDAMADRGRTGAGRAAQGAGAGAGLAAPMPAVPPGAASAAMNVRTQAAAARADGGSGR
jgi:radical SAM protein with 4Fe4S-binding SPASM domain